MNSNLHPRLSGLHWLQALLMKTRDVLSWSQSHFDYFLDAVRIYLGIGLIFKGISFLTNSAAMSEMLRGTSLANLAPIVPYAHIIGGALLAAGILTRVAALSQIPILAVAVFMVHAPQIDTIRGREAVEFSALVLFLLVIIAIKGAGPLSLMAKRDAAVSTFQKSVDEHSDLFADLIRIYLGIGLFIKGMYIMGHQTELFSIMNSGGNIPMGFAAAAHYVIPVHFVGGVLLVIGAFTRAAAIAQIPPLVGALFYLFLPRFSVLEARQSFEFTALVAFLLTLTALFGSGRLAVENSRRKVVPTPAIQPAT